MSFKNFKAQTGEIITLDVNTLKVNQSTTNVKWDNKKHPDIVLLNGSDTAKLSLNDSGPKAVMATMPFIIGTDVDTITFKINTGTVVHAGLAENSRDLSSLGPGTDLISQKFNVLSNTAIKMSLSRTLVSTAPDVYTSALSFEYDGKVTTLNATGYTGQTMYPWFSDDTTGTGFSVSVSRTSTLNVYVRPDGGVVFSTLSSNGESRPIVFETGINPVVFDNVGFSSVPSIKYDIIETSTAASNGIDAFDMTLRVTHPGAPGTSNPGVTIGQDAKLTTPLGLSSPYIESPSTSLNLRQSGGVNVTIDAAGSMVLPSSLTATSLISSVLQPSVGTDVSVLESGGKGIVVKNVTGDTYIGNRLSVGDSGDLTSTAVLANFNTAAQNKALVVPTVTDVTVGTISAPNQVLGMIVYSIADAKFMGFAASGWVALNV